MPPSAPSWRPAGAPPSWRAPCRCAATAPRRGACTVPAAPAPRRWLVSPPFIASACRPLRRGRRLAPGDAEAAAVHCCFALIAALEDTNLLHRGGSGGLAFARRAASAFLDRGGVGAPGWRDEASRIHRAFVARHLSPGGSADLLAMTLFVDAWEAA